MKKRKYLLDNELEYIKKFWIKETQESYTWIYKILGRCDKKNGPISVKLYKDGKFITVSNFEYPNKSHCKANSAKLELLTKYEFLIEVL
jgi:hypothetical protein